MASQPRKEHRNCVHGVRRRGLSGSRASVKLPCGLLGDGKDKWDVWMEGLVQAASWALSVGAREPWWDAKAVRWSI